MILRGARTSGKKLENSDYPRTLSDTNIRIPELRMFSDARSFRPSINLVKSIVTQTSRAKNGALQVPVCILVGTVHAFSMGFFIVESMLSALIGSHER